MSVNSQQMADVRFFGAHDKAWVSVKDCYLYSIKDPNSGKQKRNDIQECVKELDRYVENLKKIYGTVILAPFKESLEPGKQNKHLQALLPTWSPSGKDGGENAEGDKIVAVDQPKEVIEGEEEDSGDDEEDDDDDDETSDEDEEEEEESEEEGDDEDDESDDDRPLKSQRRRESRVTNGKGASGTRKVIMTRIDYNKEPSASGVFILIFLLHYTVWL